MPTGLQIVGQRWQEMRLLAVAELLDQEVGGFQHPIDIESIHWGNSLGQSTSL